MQLLDQVRLIARAAPSELLRYFSERNWKRKFVKQLESLNVNVVFDIGSNTGQYAAGLRKAGYQGRMISFEPLSQPFATLERRASKDPLWDCRRYALGDADGTVSVNIAGNAAQSSSVLPMLKSHQDAFPPANYVGVEDVAVYRLDSVASEILRPTDVTFLKIDVQGFEKQVLAGSETTLANSCVGMQLELSFLPLYEGSMLIPEALEWAYSMGFTLTGLLPCFIDPRDGRMLQADGVFLREKD
ncbi:FkbM family methyltransferase [Mycobacterium intracellulare]|uniref:FkbM family methyltransferase n=1 Tax=Mycobacterium intracellulare TaxID=1767 RepID=UPI000BAC29E3|nr:FkbM family methyltransferase [Mycobacterium intracellulare]ASX01105.1 FkbM family methyltransferase [Mycobacterium intracellulare subsp. chimaera]PBA60695.1 FkbM family methyltransferase [Mycobacterium intracellulare subsp. chimaera]